VRLACGRPDPLGRRLSPWDGTARARQLIAEGIVAEISAAPVRRMLTAHQLQPWRQHLWLSPQRPRASAYDATIAALIDPYTRPWPADAMVLSVAEKTALQPRPRLSPTRPAQPGNLPHRDAHEDTRRGALHVFAAVDTRAGTVSGPCHPRTRQPECIAFREP
jgi:hypothetical protein